ncbi:MAG: hypothetical protein OEL56_07530 [Nitrosopumilus sp.]|nr:hypothetical protein [Nitrosopumilus sp.]MDH3517023.1 hypothetical protein [Nitrosopumilus sp.]MDH3565628.1 hypothetical protein [Nitrosopumilus sp.]MDH5417357.1 hypothetical protein [Nitrosopumilus sp.]MDH5555180.1 hypothetical protein [Nitrosopumilus sp.]
MEIKDNHHYRLHLNDFEICLHFEKDPGLGLIHLHGIKDGEIFVRQIEILPDGDLRETSDIGNV